MANGQGRYVVCGSGMFPSFRITFDSAPCGSQVCGGGPLYTCDAKTVPPVPCPHGESCTFTDGRGTSFLGECL
jgi:hypothetical protein